MRTRRAVRQPADKITEQVTRVGIERAVREHPGLFGKKWSMESQINKTQREQEIGKRNDVLPSDMLTDAVYLAASTSGDRETFVVQSAELSRSSPLQREERILSSLCSPHVVSCFGSGITVEPDGRVLFNLFVEYVPRGDLAEVVKRQGGLDESTIVLYTRGVLNGLEYLHGRSIVHCDVKGNNILIG
ncbi:hypothetical protein Taro_038373 [Colocasia esculenta]|uniref:Protein kinase domain-containing protein n=1 Tax=Colocasia esculenta TaxID=4460 RepID=A0A843WNJ3_COLES|nr:hypothetical protein [Colocasia esculenta]